MSGRREAAAVLALLAALLVAAYGNVVFLGRSLVYSDNLNPLDFRVALSTHGPGFVPAAVWQQRDLLPTANFADPGAALNQWEPAGEFLRRALRDRECPWWDPYVGAGAPAMANLIPAFFFPPYLLLVALGNGVVAKNVYFLLMLLQAAFCSWLLLRRHGLGCAAALAGAVAVLFSGALNQNVGSFLGQTAACLPATLLATRWCLERPGRRRLAALAAVYAAVALASFPPLLYANFGLAALYAALFIATSANRRQLALRYLAAVATGMGLVAFYYVPALFLAAGTPQIEGYYGQASRSVFPWVGLTHLLSPVLMSGGLVLIHPFFGDRPQDAGATIPYVGVVALLAAALAWPLAAVGRRRFQAIAATGIALIAVQLLALPAIHRSTLPGLPVIHFLAKTALPYVVLAVLAAALPAALRAARGWRTKADGWHLGMLIALAVPLIVAKLVGLQPVQWLCSLPGLRTVHFANYLGIPLAYLLAFGAALGLEHLLAGRVPRSQAWLAILGLGLVVVALPAVASGNGVLARPLAAFWLARWSVLAGLLAVAAGCAVALAGRSAPSVARRRLAAGGFVALLAIEGLLNTVYPRQRRFDVWRHPPRYVTELLARRDAGRVLGGGGGLYANTGSAFQLAELDSLMPFNSPRVFDLYKRYANPDANLFIRDAQRLPPEGVLDAANVASLAVLDYDQALVVEARRRRYREVFADGYIHLFSRPTEPRYYFTSRFREVTPAAALDELAGRRLPREALLERHPGVAALAVAGDAPPVAVTSFRRNRVRLRLRAPRPGLVYCSEAFSPGWRAAVNGRPAEILRANFAFRAVPVPAGDVAVELEYEPPGLRPGIAISILAGCCLGFLVLRRDGATASAAPPRPVP
jgi:uncharacterized membrane protein YhaH (DUF805 family)